MEKRLLLPITGLLLFLLMLNGCKNSGASAATLPSQYVGKYSGTWITTDTNGPVTETPDNHGTWSMTVNIYGFTDLIVVSADGTSVNETPLAQVAGTDSKCVLTAAGDFMDQFYGEITPDGSSISGTWAHADMTSDASSGTFTGTKQ